VGGNSVSNIALPDSDSFRIRPGVPNHVNPSHSGKMVVSKVDPLKRAPFGIIAFFPSEYCHGFIISSVKSF
jgi:hypothetical protein